MALYADKCSNFSSQNKYITYLRRCISYIVLVVTLLFNNLCTSSLFKNNIILNKILKILLKIILK